MSVHLVAEVVRFLAGGADLTPPERLVLLLIAERANQKTRQAWPGGADEWSLAQLVGLSPRRLREVLAALAAHGLEVRVARGKDALGRPVYGAWNVQTTYQLPDLGGGISPPTSDAQAAESRPLVGGGIQSPRRRNPVAQAAESGSPGGGIQSPRRRNSASLPVIDPQDRQVREGPSSARGGAQPPAAPPTHAEVCRNCGNRTDSAYHRNVCSRETTP